MAQITGANTNAIYRQGATHGTAVAGGSGHKLILGEGGSITHDAPSEILHYGGVGSGLSMYTDAIKGSQDFTVGIENFVCGYGNMFDVMLAAFMGASSSPAEQTASQGDYLHRITYSPTASKFGTVAFEATSAKVFEYPSSYCTGVTISTGNPNGFLTSSFQFMADQRKLNSSTNTNATLAAATLADDEIIVHNQGDEFLINTQAGSGLATPTDRVSITSLTLSLNDPRSIVREFKGSNINSAPIRSDLFNGTLSIEMAGLSDFTWYDAQDNETAYKAKFIVEGSQIAAGDNYTFSIYIPRMKVLAAPGYNPSNLGINPHTVVFELLKADSNPTGMNSTYPYFEFINLKSAALIS